jgi:hypothetical protein
MSIGKGSEPLVLPKLLKYGNYGPPLERIVQALEKIFFFVLRESRDYRERPLPSVVVLVNRYTTKMQDPTECDVPAIVGLEHLFGVAHVT